MAEVVVLRNPLDVSRRRRVHLADGVALLEWVDEQEPAGGHLQRAVYVNGRPCTDRAYCVKPGDEVLVAFSPGGITVGALIIQTLVSFAIGYILNVLFGAKRPAAADTPQASQVYGIAAPRNAARLGQPIPVIYGAVIILPDFAAQPYTVYEGNDMFLHALLCIGQGEHDVLDMLLGDSSVKPLDSSVVQWSVWQPQQHNSQFGLIEGNTRVRENVVTVPTVADQELIAPNAGGVLQVTTWYWQDGPYTEYTDKPVGYTDLSGLTTLQAKLAALPANPALGTKVNVIVSFGPRSGGLSGMAWRTTAYTATVYDAAKSYSPGSLIPPPSYSQAGSTKWIGPFQTCKKGQHGSLLELDFVFAGGLYAADSSGNLQNCAVTVTVGYRPIDGNGDPTGAETQYTETFQAHDNTPQRFTRTHPVPSGRYMVRCARSSNSDLKATTADRATWAGLKFQLDPPAAGTVVYGNVTLVAVKLKATAGIASNAASSMRFRVKRRLAPLGSGAPAPTANPADAFVDVLCAAYGGARPVAADELDLPELTASRAAWATHDGFNAVFDQPSTVWEALGLTVQTVHAAPLPVGSRMSLIHDQVQPVRSQLFTDANIVEGTLKVNQAFDRVGTPEGVRVNWRDPATFSPVALYMPEGKPDYSTVDLFGCTSQAVAQEHANLTVAKRQRQRSSIDFETELEGLSILPGDRIGVAAGMVKWAQSARVEGVAGLTITLSTPLVWTANATHVALLRAPTGAPVRVPGVTRGGADNVVVLPSDPGFVITGANASQEATALAFGVQDAEVTDWTVTKVTPNGTTVTVEAVNYDPAIYSGAAAFTREAIMPTLEDEEALA